MARSAIKLTRDQREAIYQAVRTHLVGLSDVFTLLERQDDVPGAEKLAREFADDFRLLAREAGKYKIGMIYSTQQVSSVEPDVLDNTANWIIAHLNSESEVRLLRGRYEFDRFAEQILRAEDVGFVRIKTQSSRFVVPVQVRMFDEAMVAAAREATPHALEV
jgi:hypothetical protein